MDFVPRPAEEVLRMEMQASSSGLDRTAAMDLIRELHRTERERQRLQDELVKLHLSRGQLRESFLEEIRELKAELEKLRFGQVDP